MYKRGRVGQTARALQLLDALRGFKLGRTLSELAVKLGVSERTIRRDLKELEDAGVRLEFSLIDGRAAARLLEASYSDVPMTRRERYTLLAMRRVFDGLRGTAFHEDVASILAKVEQPMTTAERKEHTALGELFSFVPDGGTKSYQDKADVIDALQTGILGGRMVRFTYRDLRGRARSGEFAPFVMVLYRQGLYVVGARVGEGYASPDLHDWRVGRVVLAIERFGDVEPLRKRRFEIPGDFRLDEVLHGAFGIHIGDATDARKVVIEFSAEKAALVSSRVWHETQQITRVAGGRVQLSFVCTNLLPVVSFVLEWGPHARVLEPTELVTSVIDELERAREQYIRT